MSEIDPYAPNTEEAAFVNPVAAEEAPVEAPEAPVTPELVVPEGSIKKVLDWVGEDATRAQAALAAENDGDTRSSLVAKLEAILN